MRTGSRCVCRRRREDNGGAWLLDITGTATVDLLVAVLAPRPQVVERFAETKTVYRTVYRDRYVTPRAYHSYWIYEPSRYYTVHYHGIWPYRYFIGPWDYRHYDPTFRPYRYHYGPIYRPRPPARHRANGQDRIHAAEPRRISRELVQLRRNHPAPANPLSPRAAGPVRATRAIKTHAIKRQSALTRDCALSTTPATQFPPASPSAAAPCVQLRQAMSAAERSDGSNAGRRQRIAQPRVRPRRPAAIPCARTPAANPHRTSPRAQPTRRPASSHPMRANARANLHRASPQAQTTPQRAIPRTPSFERQSRPPAAPARIARPPTATTRQPSAAPARPRSSEPPARRSAPARARPTFERR